MRLRIIYKLMVMILVLSGVSGCKGYVGKAHVFTGRYRLVEDEVESSLYFVNDEYGCRLIEEKKVEWDIEQQFNIYKCSLDYSSSDDGGELLLFVLCGFNELPDPFSETGWKSYYFKTPPDIPGADNDDMKLYYTAPGGFERTGQFFAYPFVPCCSIGSVKSTPPISVKLKGTHWKSLNRKKSSFRRIPVSNRDIYRKDGKEKVLVGKTDLMGYFNVAIDDEMYANDGGHFVTIKRDKKLEKGA